MEWIHNNVMKKKPIEIPNRQLFKCTILCGPGTMDISVGNMSFLGLGGGRGDSPESKVSNRPLAV